MKKGVVLLFLSAFVMSCTSYSSQMNSTAEKTTQNDTLRIANAEIDYEIIIFEPGFNAWLLSTARPREFYSQNFLESRNRVWVMAYNQRVLQPYRYDSKLYVMQIDYQNQIDYGYEVNYLLYNYLVYFQQKYKQRLGGFEPRL